MLLLVLKTSIISGLVFGILLSIFSILYVSPILFDAENYEGEKFQYYNNSTLFDNMLEKPGFSGFEKTEEEWLPAKGLERTVFTLLSNVLLSIGFAFFLSASFLFIKNLTIIKAIGLGIIGYMVFLFLPAMGITPEIPGMQAADLTARQSWWALTVVCSAIGFILILRYYKSAVYISFGILLIILPHIIGAPQPESFGGSAPENIFRSFLTAVFISNLIYWIGLGGFTGFLFRKFQSQ